MSAGAAGAATVPGRSGGPGRFTAGFRDAAAAEWLKLRSLRSTWWTLAATFVLTVAVGLLYGTTIGNHPEDYRKDVFDPVLMGFAGVSMSQMAIVCFGVMAVSGEYTTGTIRASLTAVPDRTVFWAAKAAVVGAVALAVSLPTAFATFFAAQTSMGSELNAGLGDPGALRATFGLALHLTLLCLVSAGVAAVLRGTVITLGVLVPLFFIVGDLLASLPGVGQVARFLPNIAGSRLMSTVPDSRIGYGPGPGLLVILAWTCVALACGLAALRRRDA
ncbi:ABC transporter permease [Streptomyces sp. NPDC051018]|uniref:ABC transporter permease n=1 Tax=Streptomyces sp. NPDC051018 TaxID=3365639 RepID=UPI0037A85D3A